MTTADPQQPEAPIALCTVCAKKIRADEDQTNAEFRGESFPVCRPSCEQKFRAAPELYTVR